MSEGLKQKIQEELHRLISEDHKRISQQIQEMKVAITLEHTHPHPEFWKGWNKAIDEISAVLGGDGKEKARS